MSHLRPTFLKPSSSYDSAAAGGGAISSHSIGTERLNESEQELELAKYNAHTDMSMEVQRQQLPVFRHRNHILYAVATSRVVVVVGETGSGKSTQLPQYLLESGWTNAQHMVCVVEPRRIATINLAKRVCDEKACLLGHEVGYAIRFENCFAPGTTRIKFVTDGLLIRELMQNPLLPQYSVIILDEVHERNANTDIIIGLLKKVMKKRDDLRLIVCSATVDAEGIKFFFDESKSSASSSSTAATAASKKTTSSETSLSTTIITVEGRYFPVDIFHLTQACDNYVRASVQTAFSIHLTQGDADGDILIFLTGQDEVDDACAQLIERASDLKSTARSKHAATKDLKKLWVLPLYGSLPIAEQLKVFERAQSRATRKIIVSTNIAETSLTIHGIVFVVDCGFMKLKAYDAKLGGESLITVAVSRSSANQRAGRAGRYRSGKAYRLYAEAEYAKLREYTVPEMQRCDLAPIVVQLKALGIDNICRFDFLSSPPSGNLVSSLELLHALGALDDDCHLTRPLGTQIAELPLHPTYAKALLSADSFGCAQEMLSIVAMLQVQHVFSTPAGRKQTADKAKLKFTAAEGDHITLLNVFKTFRQRLNGKNKKSIANWCGNNYLNYKSLLRAIQIREQLALLLRKFSVSCQSTCEDKTEPILKCLCVSFFANAAKAHYSGDYRHLKATDVTLKVHPSSVINLYLANVVDQPPPKYVIYNDIVQSKSCLLMRDLSVIDCKWLHELVPNYYSYGTERELHAESHKRLKLS